MDEYLVFASIGGLLILTILVNSIAEAYEIRKREKHLKILKIKQSIDEITELLEQLKTFNISHDIVSVLVNEMISRLQLIQKLDSHFRGIKALIDEADHKVKQQAANPEEQHSLKTEAEFRTLMVFLRRLIMMLDSPLWFSNITTGELKQSITYAKVFRCEKITQFYTDKAAAALENKKYILAKEHYYYITNALKSSGAAINPRVAELLEQTEFMQSQVSVIMLNNNNMADVPAAHTPPSQPSPSKDRGKGL